jgi:hypothetical protein
LHLYFLTRVMCLIICLLRIGGDFFLSFLLRVVGLRRNAGSRMIFVWSSWEKITSTINFYWTILTTDCIIWSPARCLCFCHKHLHTTRARANPLHFNSHYLSKLCKSDLRECHFLLWN